MCCSWTIVLDRKQQHDMSCASSANAVLAEHMRQKIRRDLSRWSRKLLLCLGKIKKTMYWMTWECYPNHPNPHDSFIQLQLTPYIFIGRLFSPFNQILKINHCIKIFWYAKALFSFSSQFPWTSQHKKARKRITTTQLLRRRIQRQAKADQKAKNFWLELSLTWGVLVMSTSAIALSHCYRISQSHYTTVIYHHQSNLIDQFIPLYPHIHNLHNLHTYLIHA